MNAGVAKLLIYPRAHHKEYERLKKTYGTTTPWLFQINRPSLVTDTVSGGPLRGPSGKDHPLKILGGGMILKHDGPFVQLGQDTRFIWINGNLTSVSGVKYRLPIVVVVAFGSIYRPASAGDVFDSLISLQLADLNDLLPNGVPGRRYD